jgi:Tfp pilus assembly protein PilO
MRQSSKRILSGFIALLFLLLAFIIFAYLIKPVYTEIQSLRGDVLIRKNDLETQKNLANKLKELRDKYYGEDFQKIQQAMSLILPENPEIAESLIQLNGLITANNLSLDSITVSRPILINLNDSNNSNSRATSTSILKPIGSFDVVFKTKGEYNDFKNFLNQLETNIRFFNIKTIDISSSNVVDSLKQGSKSTLNFDITASVYYQSK